MFVRIILHHFPLALQLLTEKLLAELRVFNEAAEKEKEALQVRLTLFQSQTGSEHLVLREIFFSQKKQENKKTRKLVFHLMLLWSLDSKCLQP